MKDPIHKKKAISRKSLASQVILKTFHCRGNQIEIDDCNSPTYSRVKIS